MFHSSQCFNNTTLGIRKVQSRDSILSKNISRDSIVIAQLVGQGTVDDQSSINAKNLCGTLLTSAKEVFTMWEEIF